MAVRMSSSTSKAPQGGARPGAPPQLCANVPSLVVTDSPRGQWPSTATRCLETPVGLGYSFNGSACLESLGLVA